MPGNVSPLFDSPVYHLLNSNHEPNREESLAIKRAISNARRELNGVLSIPQTDHGSLYIAQLASFIRAHEALLSPIRCLPVELLSEIFAYVALDRNVDVKYPPVILSQVCRLWRVACLNTPLIFTVLPQIWLTKHTASSSRNELEFFINKAPANSLLSFEIAHFAPDMHPVFEALVERSERWNCVSLNLEYSILRQLDPFLTHTVNNLRKLQLKIRPNSTGVYGNSFGFEYAPALHEVEIDCPGPMLLRLPWRQLTTFKERSLSTIGVPLVARNGASIKHFIYSSAGESPIPFHFAPATLPFLKTMDIRLYHDDHQLAFQLTTPSLVELRLRDHAPDSNSNLIQLLDHTLCNDAMRRLSFHVSTLNCGDLTRMLLLLPNLEELECNDIPTDDLRNLSQESEGLVPRLRKLVIHEPSHLSEIDTLITSRSHFRPPRTLASDSDEVPGLLSVRLIFPFPKDCDRASLALGAEGHKRQTVVVAMDALIQLHAVVEVYKKKDKWKKGLKYSFSDRKEALRINTILISLEKYEFESFSQLEVRYFLSIFYLFVLLTWFFKIVSCRVSTYLGISGYSTRKRFPTRRNTNLLIGLVFCWMLG